MKGSQLHGVESLDTRTYLYVSKWGPLAGQVNVITNCGFHHTGFIFPD